MLTSCYPLPRLFGAGCLIRLLSGVPAVVVDVVISPFLGRYRAMLEHIRAATREPIRYTLHSPPDVTLFVRPSPVIDILTLFSFHVETSLPITMLTSLSLVAFDALAFNDSVT